MARGIGLIWVYRIFMTGHRFDSRTRDFDITIFASERVWEIKGIRILVTLLAWFFGFGFVAVCGFSPLSAFFFLVLGQKKKIQEVFRNWYTIISSLELVSSRLRLENVAKCICLFRLCNRTLYHFTVNSSYT